MKDVRIFFLIGFTLAILASATDVSSKKSATDVTSKKSAARVTDRKSATEVTAGKESAIKVIDKDSATGVSGEESIFQSSQKKEGVRRRFRRMLGRRTQCIPKLKTFCQVFTHNDVNKPFCLTVIVKHCVGLD